LALGETTRLVSMDSRIGDLGVGTFLVLTTTIAYLFFCCLVGIFTLSNRGIAIISVSLVYGLITTMLLLAPREDELSSITYRADEVDTLWVFRLFLGVFFGTCSCAAIWIICRLTIFVNVQDMLQTSIKTDNLDRITTTPSIIEETRPIF